MELHANGSKAIPDTNGPHVLEVLRSAQEDLARLMQERAEITRRIGTVKQLIVGMTKLFGDEILNEELLVLLNRKGNVRQRGLTGGCRLALMQSQRPQSAREVCEQVQRSAPSVLARHKDPVASVTTVLNRLAEYGEAQSMIRADGRRAWEWVADSSEAGFEEIVSARA